MDEQWNPQWPADWQRRYAAVREMLAEENELAYLEPGVTVHGMDVGRWLQRQRQHTIWHGLKDGQRLLLEQLGITPLPPEQEAPSKAPKTASGAFERGIVARAASCKTSTWERLTGPTEPVRALHCARPLGGILTLSGWPRAFSTARGLSLPRTSSIALECVQALGSRAAYPSGYVAAGRRSVRRSSRS
ncbi:helicase associated domain-containing protein [Streptomyces coeruleorubidus]|uniref:helicase associated domain-containing protein n=1 Tax=Streptomyces coeruleorubidus TaxID=116188 RepID=UPI00380EEFED